MEQRIHTDPAARVEKPAHRLPRRYYEPILFLAERISRLDRITPGPEPSGVDELSRITGIEDYKQQRWYRDMDDESACAKLDLDTAKKGALVALIYVMKSDTTRGEKARAYFTKVRTLLGAEPVAVPSEPEDHRDLLRRYLGG